VDAGAALKLGATSAPDDSAPEQVEMPLPSDLRTAFEGGLFLLALLAALYATREIVLPVVLAFVLRLVLQPAVRLLERLRAPGVLSALLLIAILLGAVVAALYAQSRARRPVAHFLVLDVGRPGRNSGRPHARGDEDHLRPDPDAGSRRPLPGGMNSSCFLLLGVEAGRTRHHQRQSLIWSPFPAVQRRLTGVSCIGAELEGFRGRSVPDEFQNREGDMRGPWRSSRPADGPRGS
jgi:hypothetical protein